MKSSSWAVTFRSLVASLLRLACFCVVLLQFASSSFGQDFYLFSTLAGKANAGFANGTGLAAKFNSPWGMVIDAAGNFYVAETENHAIRKITPGGVVSTFAGEPGWPGNVDGAGSAARFNTPHGLAIDGAGNLYVAEGSNTIRKITPAGIVSTLAGLAGTAGSADGTGSAARFNNPFAVAVDAAGANIYVTDTLNHTIRHITAAGVVTTFAGSAGVSGNVLGTGAAARFSVPQGIVVAPGGNLFVADSGNRVIKTVSSAGVVGTYAGNGIGTLTVVDGFGPLASFSSNILGLALDAAGNLYAADTTRVRRITPPVLPETRPLVSTIAGPLGSPSGYADGSGATALFNGTASLAVSATGDVYVAERRNHLIRRIAFVGPNWTVSSFAGSIPTVGSADGTGELAQFKFPVAVALDGAGNVFVVDASNFTIRKITPGGGVTTIAGSPGLQGSANGNGASARFNGTSGIAVDAAGNLFLADTGNNLIRKIAPNGDVSTFAGIAGGPTTSVDGNLATARFVSPFGLTVAADGVIYVAEGGGAGGGGRIRKIATDGQVTTIAGGTLGFVSVDGNGLAAGFFNPWALVTDNAGHLFIAERSVGKVRKMDLTTGDVTTIYQANPVGLILGLAIDGAGNLFISLFNTVIRYAPDATVTTVGGLAGTSGSADGVGENARFQTPFGLAASSSGTLYIADSGNSTIRKGTPVFATNTPAGSDVVVAPEPVDENGDPVPNAPTVTAVFDTVTASGETTATITADGPDLPAGFRLGEPAFFIDLHTTATFTGLVTVSIDYSGLTFSGPPEDLALLHYKNGVWEDITTGNDTALHFITGETDSFSPFAVLRALSPLELLDELSDTVADLDARRSVIAGLQDDLRKIKRVLSDRKTRNDDKATPLLRNFITEVEKLKRKQLPAAQADELVDLAQEIIEVLPAVDRPHWPGHRPPFHWRGKAHKSHQSHK